MKPTEKTLSAFRKIVLERLHGCSYEQFLESNKYDLFHIYGWSFFRTEENINGWSPITIGRLMAVLPVDFCTINEYGGCMSIIKYDDGSYDIPWRRLRKDKTECNETDQSEETLLSIIKLLS